MKVTPLDVTCPVIYSRLVIVNKRLRGQGGSEVDFHFLIVSDIGACQLPGTFFRMKNIVPSQSYRIFKSQKNIQLHYARELLTRFPKNQLQNLYSPTNFKVDP